ncbi:hypothetical protein [Streptomyces sp. NBC_00009]|uniref:hypothetical protein n=1 Tax=Streptomyces sp. NBC_00009 TaxID=2975620 RepID=UPI00324C3210
MWGPVTCLAVRSSGLALSPDGSRLYVGERDSAETYDTSNYALTATTYAYEETC